MSQPDDDPDFDLDALLRTAGAVSGVNEQLRQAAIITHTGAHVLGDQLNADVQAGKDVIDGQVQAGRDATGAVVSAGQDLGDGYSRAAHDALHGNLLAAPVDVISGQVKATTDLVEGGLRGIKDVAVGDLKAAGHLIQGGEHVVHDLAQGAADLIGLSSDDKAGTLKKVGAEDPGKLKADAAQEKAGKGQLQDVKRSLAQKNPRAVGTADQILDAGAPGLHFFEYFLPAYNAWTGGTVTMTQIRQAYDRERGLSFTALMADADLISGTGDRVQDVVATLQQAYNALVPAWQGQAAQQFETTMATYFTAGASVHSDFADAAKGIGEVVLALQQVVYTKASMVSQMYAQTLPPGIDGVQAKHAMVAVAHDDRPDQVRRWVLGTLHQPMHGRHFTDDDNDMWSVDCLDDRSRRLAQQVAGQWCNDVLAELVGQRLQEFFQLCDRTTQSINELFDSLVHALQAVKDPFAGMPLTQPTDAPPSSGGSTAPQGGAPGGPGGGGSGGSGSGFPTGPGGTPPVSIPPISTPPISTPPVSTPPVSTPPTTTPPTTNPDGSVTFGTGGDLRIGTENPDGSFDLVQTTGGTAHDYRLAFGPNGRPVLVSVDGQAAAAGRVPPAADGSLDLGGVTVGPDQGGAGFTVTEGATGSAGAGYGVTYDAAGHPHVSDLLAGDPGTVRPVDPTVPTSVPTAPATGHHTVSGGGTTAAAFAGGGSDASSGGASLTAHAAGAADPAANGNTGNTYGTRVADASGSGIAPAATAGAAAAASGGGGSHGGATGMPMMPMAGMGAGGAGNAQDLKRRYQPPPESIVDGEELDEWDRLGPTIG